MKYVFNIKQKQQIAYKFKILRMTAAAVFLFSTLSGIAQLVLPKDAKALTNYTAVPFTPTEVTTNWAADRTEPSGGYRSVSFGDRDDVLELSIDNTAASATTGFYRTEGVKSSIAASDAVKADLYVASDWSAKPVRAGIWGVGRDSTNAISSYPIIEFTTIGDGGTYTGWRVYNVMTGDWIDQPTADYPYDSWNSVEISLNPTTNLYDYIINGTKVQSMLTGDTISLNEVIFNDFNSATTSSDNYDVHWSNFATGSYSPDAQTVSEENIYGDTSSGENQPGWLFNRDVTTATPYEFNTDQASIGNGSLYVLPITNGSSYGNT